MTLLIHITFWQGEPRKFEVASKLLMFTDVSVFVGHGHHAERFFLKDVKEMAVKVIAN